MKQFIHYTLICKCGVLLYEEDTVSPTPLDNGAKFLRCPKCFACYQTVKDYKHVEIALEVKK